MIGKRTLAFAVLLAIVAFSLLSLATGASYLGSLLLGVLPFGNLLAAALFAALAGFALLAPLSAKQRHFALATLAAALAWLPLSGLLAGNAALNFSGNRGVAWLALTSGILLLVLVSLGLSLVSLWQANRHRGAT